MFGLTLSRLSNSCTRKKANNTEPKIILESFVHEYECYRTKLSIIREYHLGVKTIILSKSAWFSFNKKVLVRTMTAC